MKRILFATAGICALAAGAWAMDGKIQETSTEREHHTVRIADGTVIELRGENGERTLHIERDGADTELTVNGQRVEIVDGFVIIDGQRIDSPEHGVIIVEGDEVRIVEGGDHHARFGREMELHLAERAEHLAEMRVHLADMAHNGEFDFDFDFDFDGMERDIVASLEEALASMDGDVRINGRDWDDLTPEEQAEVRAELAEAREEIRTAMREVHVEMREAARDMEENRREMRIEIERATREVAEAERELARVRVERVHRDAEMARHHAERAREMAEHDRHVWVERMGDAEDIRVEEDETGRRRIWVDGEEQTGDDLTEWLNRLQVDSELMGGPGSGERRVHRLRLADSDRQVIDLDDGERVVVIERHIDTQTDE